MSVSSQCPQTPYVGPNEWTFSSLLRSHVQASVPPRGRGGTSREPSGPFSRSATAYSSGADFSSCRRQRRSQVAPCTPHSPGVTTFTMSPDGSANRAHLARPSRSVFRSSQGAVTSQAPAQYGIRASSSLPRFRRPPRTKSPRARSRRPRNIGHSRARRTSQPPVTESGSTPDGRHFQ